MITNAFEVSTWIAMESVDLLTNALGLSNYFDKEHGKQFKLNFPVGDSVKIPFPDMGSIRRGLMYNPSPLATRSATMQVFDPFGIDFELDSVETALFSTRSKAEFSKRILKPKLARLAQEIDSQCAQWAYQHAASVVGALGTNPTTYDATSAAARQVMKELGCPDDGEGRGLFMPPVVHRGIKGANLSLRNPVGTITDQFNEGVIDYSDGFDWKESMSLYRHTAGTWAGAVTVTTAPANGATTLSLTCTTGDTFKVGDKFAMANVLPVNHMTKRTFGTSTKTFSCLGDGAGNDVTGASSAATITITPPIYFSGPHQNVDTQPAASAALTLWPGTTSPSGKAGIVGLALHKLAFGLVGIELEMPSAGTKELASQQRDPDSGIVLSYIRDFDTRSRKKINRIDVQVGFGDFFNDACAVAVACG